MTTSSKNTARLYRSEKDRVLGGVAGGVGEFFDVDPSLIRILFVLFVIFGGSGVIIYLVLWLIIPSESKIKAKMEDQISENAKEITTKAEEIATLAQQSVDRKDVRMWLGIVVVVLGISLLSGNLGIFNVARLWPILVIVVGIMILFRKS